MLSAFASCVASGLGVGKFVQEASSGQTFSAISSLAACRGQVGVSLSDQDR